MDDNGLDTGFRGRELWRDGLSSKFKEGKVSDTPRTDVAELAEEGEDCVDYAVQHLANLARQLERELSDAQAKIAALTASGEYGELPGECRVLATWPHVDDQIRAKLNEASTAIERLQARVRQLESMNDDAARLLVHARVAAEQAEARLAKYDELLYAVVNKYPNESRHETALRYIRERDHLTDAVRQKEGAS